MSENKNVCITWIIFNVFFFFFVNAFIIFFKNIVGGVKMRYPSCYVLVTDLDDSTTELFSKNHNSHQTTPQQPQQQSQQHQSQQQSINT